MISDELWEVELKAAAKEQLGKPDAEEWKEKAMT
jgi:hypothetical protein